MLTHPKSTMRVLRMLLHLTSGHVTLYQVNFAPRFINSHQTYGAGPPHVGFCPIFLVLLNYRSFKAIAGCPPDSSSSRTARRARQHAQRATPRSAQNWLWTNCPDFISKDQWPPNSLDMNPMDYHVWVQCWKLTASLKQSRRQSLNSSKRFRLSGATCHRDRSTRL